MKTEQPADRREMYRSAMAPHVAEPILAIGIVSPGGALKALKTDYSIGKSIGQVSPVIGLLYRRKKMAATSAENISHVVAVTATSVHLFPIPLHPTPFSLTGPPTTWPRFGLKLVADKPKRHNQQLHITLASGDQHHVEIGKAGAPGWCDFSDEVRDLLATPVGNSVLA